MWHDVRNLKTSELHVSGHWSGLEREWLIGLLLSKTGVRNALYRDDDPHRLIVQYDAGLVNSSDLSDFLYTRGLHTEDAALG